MNDMNSLPNVSTASINAMQKEADRRMQQDGFEIEKEPQDQVLSIEDIVQEPVEQEDYEEDEAQEVEELVLTKHQMDFAAIRKAKVKAERERDELMRILAAQSNQQPQKQSMHEEEQEFSIDIDDDSLVEGKQIKQLLAEMKHMKKELRSYQTQSGKQAQQTVDMRLRSQYPDIDQVLTSDNIDMLRQMDPDLAETIGDSKDMYKKASLAYKMIKQYGIVKDKQPSSHEQLLAKKNSLKPKPLASISPQQGDSPISNVNAFANGLTADLKKQLYREMMESAKRS